MKRTKTITAKTNDTKVKVTISIENKPGTLELYEAEQQIDALASAAMQDVASTKYMNPPLCDVMVK